MISISSHDVVHGKGFKTFYEITITNFIGRKAERKYFKAGSLQEVQKAVEHYFTCNHGFAGEDGCPLCERISTEIKE